jgi:hypothetical protein
MANLMTTAGDIIVGGQDGTPTGLPLGSSGQIITSNGTSLAWADNSPSLPIATTTTLGGIKPDETIITVDSSTRVASAAGGRDSSGDWAPSFQYLTITYGVSGDMYTAPGDGWICAKCTTTNINAYIIGEVIISDETSAEISGSHATTYSTSRTLSVLFSVARGYILRCLIAISPSTLFDLSIQKEYSNVYR